MEEGVEEKENPAKQTVLAISGGFQGLKEQPIQQLSPYGRIWQT